jgi:hypothetical protein
MTGCAELHGKIQSVVIAFTMHDEIVVAVIEMEISSEVRRIGFIVEPAIPPLLIRQKPTGIEISPRPELQKINFCIMGQNSRFTGDFGLQKFVAKVHSSARTFTMARKFWTNQGGAR